MCKFLLLQTAAPDAIIRLEHTKLVNEKKEIEDIYFRQQHHRSIEDFLKYSLHVQDTGKLMQVSVQLVLSEISPVKFKQLLQVTTHSHLLSQDEFQSLKSAVGVKIFSFFLHEFDTELDFTNKLRYVML